jgi:hypothetical protein
MPLHTKEFPLWLRVLLVLTILLFAANVFFALVSVVAIVGLLQTNTLFTGLIGLAAGATFSYFGTRILDAGRRKNEARDVSESLYNEIADRAARCLNDYLVPWRKFESKGKMTRARVAAAGGPHTLSRLFIAGRPQGEHKGEDAGR